MKTSIIKTLIFSVSFLTLILFTPECKKENTDLIPYMYVNFYINPNSTQYLGINNIGGYVYVTGGVKGIIIYRSSEDEFVALERNCPYKPSSSCATVQVDNSGIVAVDSCCGSKFLLLDGSIVKGPATSQLKLYQTSFDGNTLHVFN